MRDLVNLFVIPGVSILSWLFPTYETQLLSTYLVADCVRPIKKERDIQIVFHHVVTVLFIIQNYFCNYGDALKLFVILESSSYLLILGRITGLKFIRVLSKIVWLLVRIVWVNWYHRYLYEYKFYTFLQLLKWLGYMWTLEILKIKLLPCHVSLFAFNELIITQADWLTSTMCAALMIPAYMHHANYTDKKWHIIDAVSVRLWIVYCIYKFWWTGDTFKIHLLGVICVFPFITTRDRTWWNLPRLLPHMLMHLVAGRGISLSLESLQ